MHKAAPPKSIIYRCIGCLVLFISQISLIACASAQTNQPIIKNNRDIKLINASPATLSGQQEKSRLALVIGNGRYQHVSQLNNPENDAGDMAASLSRVGFTVISEQNSDLQSMVRAVAAFSERLQRDKGVGLFYYAGHGFQVAGKNYLVPVDAKISKPADIRFETLELDQVLEEMAAANNRLNIVILDACRDNPFSGIFRQLNRGLAQVNAPSGTLLAYATAPGDVAADGNGRNGIYTKHLLNYLEKPELSIEALFKKVRLGVIKETSKRQIPWESSSLLGEFYFVDEHRSTNLTLKNKQGSTDLCNQATVNLRPISCLFGGH